MRPQDHTGTRLSWRGSCRRPDGALDVRADGIRSSLLMRHALNLRHDTCPRRLEYHGALCHVTSRGNARGPTFRRLVDSSPDREYFLEIPADTAERFGWVCYAYSLRG